MFGYVKFPTTEDDISTPYLVCLAPTGMAASNIQGQTLHTALKFTFGNEYKSLSDKARDLLRDQFKNVHIIIIDEYSMMKSSQLYHLHLRLCDIKMNDKIFGGVSIILLGDLTQLKPIRGNYIFEEPKFGKEKSVYSVFTCGIHLIFTCCNITIDKERTRSMLIY